jgi:serine/threonine protein kinase
MSRWEQVEKLCQEALELEESRRAAFLTEACAGDEDLRREVESLLKFDTRGDRFIEEPALAKVAHLIADENPELMIGQQISSYQIHSLLGAGGMGVVYQARDTRLKRFVAIKVLPPDRVSDPERKRRFIQEARAASALNHPNIITIHDIGSVDGTDFIVMEYVTGKTLDQRIPRNGMPFGEALKIAIQIADALGKAHSAGIIHRDLKPTNLMVTDEALVKVLDFGLAKLTEASGGDSGTSTLQSDTQEGMIIGTLSYMSPEQAEGKKVDARSDIFSFGAVLYEMVTGQKAFEGDSKIATLAAIVKQEPKAVSQLVPDIPIDLEKIINRCLRKDPDRRFQHVSDIKVALQELKEDSDSGVVAKRRVAAWPGRRARVMLGAATIALAVSVAIWLLRGTARKPLPAPEVIPLTSYPGSEESPSFSPDGNQVAFSWNGEKQDNYDIYITLIGSPGFLRLTTDPAADVHPVFSPDGRSIGFIRVTKDHRTFIIIPVIGGAERIVAEVGPSSFPSPGAGFDWFPDGKSVVTDGLALLSIESGETRKLTNPPLSLSPDSGPSVSPDGRTVAFTRAVSSGVGDIYLQGLTDDLRPKGEPRRLVSLNSVLFGPAWSPDGKEIFFSSYSPYREVVNLWRVASSGTIKPEQLPYGMGEAKLPAVSRKGDRLAYQRVVSDINIWRLPLSGPGVAAGPPGRFLSSTRYEGSPQYSPDGRRIAFESDRLGAHCVWTSDSDGSNATELFCQAGGYGGDPSWSPDGQHVAFSFSTGGTYNIHVIGANGGRPMRLTSDAKDDTLPSWSRDGKWIYFASKPAGPSNRTGRMQVWKMPATGGTAIQITKNGGGLAYESPDGELLYFSKPEFSGGLWKMNLRTGEEVQLLPSNAGFHFFVVTSGIYFMPEPGPNQASSVQFLSFATGKVKTVARTSGEPRDALCVSPDGRFLLFGQLDGSGSDLMLVENFR